VEFFRDQRLCYMARAARDAGRLPEALFGRIVDLSEKIDGLIEEPEAPSLIHGDIWSGNVLTKDNRVSGFLDPAVYYANPEIELAFITLFGTFGDTFFSHYEELRGIREGFFEVRRDIYNLYPLLVHVRLFGGGYVGAVESTLGRFNL
jgi:fructosamine-3-kinase